MANEHKPLPPESESQSERFKKNLAALLEVPKAEIEALEAQRLKKPRKPRKKGG